MASPTLDSCPICARQLGELSPPNRCPDCGLPFDEHTRVWRSSESWARLALVYSAIGLFLGFLIAVLQRIGLGQSLQPALPLACAIGAPALGLFFRRLIGGRISGRFVAITPTGILVGTRPRPLLIPWRDFQQVTVRRGVPKIRRGDSPVLVSIDDVFRDGQELADFRAAVKQAARRQRASGRPSPPEAPRAGAKTT